MIDSLDNIVGRIVGVIARVAEDGTAVEEVMAGADPAGEVKLIDLGITSLLLFQFIGELEADFGLEVADDDLLPENFATVEAVHNLVSRYGPGSGRTPVPASAATAGPAAPPPPVAAVAGAETIAGLPAEAAVLLYAARTRMSAEGVREARELLAGGFDWGLFLDLAARHRVLPLVARAFDRERLAPLGTVRRSQLRGAYLYNRNRNQALLTELRELLAAFAARDLRPVLRKGGYLAQCVYPEPAVRFMEDLDFYVADADLDAFGEVMAGLGYRQGSDTADRREIRPLPRRVALFWRLNVAALPPFLRPTSDPYVDVFAVDARRDLMEPSSGGSLPAADFRARARQVRLCGEEAWVPCPEDMLLDVAVHLYREATTLSSIELGKDLCLSRFLDVAELYRASHADLDADLLVSLARRYRLAEEVYFALHFTDVLHPGLLDPVLLDRLRPADLDYLDRYGDLDGQPGRWDSNFTARLFDRGRATRAAGRSALPRPRPESTDPVGDGA